MALDRKFAAARTAVLILLLVIGACSPPRNDLPPLLQGLESRGGWADGCPPAPEYVVGAKKLGLADSPEFDRRLNVQFPPGSAEQGLVKGLQQIGFHLLSSCETDHSVHIARFDEKPRPGDWVITLTTATVYWKVDRSSRIVWSKGFVFYTGP